MSFPHETLMFGLGKSSMIDLATIKCCQQADARFQLRLCRRVTRRFTVNDRDELIASPAIPQGSEDIQLCPLATYLANVTVCRVANSCLACWRYIASGSA